MWRCVDLALTDVSEEHLASIFRVEKSASGEPAWADGCRLRKSWKPLIYSLKKPPEHDARSTRLQDYEGQYTLAISSPVATESILAQ
jgi:hypothetical protein